MNARFESRRHPMVRMLALLALSCGLTATALADGDERDDGGVLSGFAGAMRPLRLPADVQRLPDIAYGSDPRGRIDAYLPPHPQHAPIIVMVHGGAWMIGNKAMPQVVQNKVVHWVERGAIFVSVGYRLVPQVGPMDQVDDIAHALAKVQQLAASWGGDPQRVALMGHSAGAHLVALLDASPAIAQRAGAQPWLGTVVLDSGALDLATLMRAPHARFYDRVFGRDPGLWRDASPFDALAAADGNAVPPMLLVCSTLRRDHSCAQSAAFATQAKAHGVRATVVEEALSHGEVNATLGTPGSETAAVDAFFDSIGLMRAGGG